MARTPKDRPPWEVEAEDAIEAALEDVEFDALSDSVRITADWYLNGEREQREFGDFGALEAELRPIAEDIIGLEGPAWWHDGEFDPEPIAEKLVARILERRGILDFFDTGSPPSDATPIIRAGELAEPNSGRLIEVDLKAIDEALIRHLASHPELMYEFSSRKFEELVAELFRGMGYDVVLTPRSRDGGRDLIAFQKSHVGTLLTLVECKRFSPDRRVGVGLVRALYGVTEHERASHSVLATTSFFTSGARAFHEEVRYRLSLADYNAVVHWCAAHRKS